MTTDLQSSSLPPPQPSYIFRGHSAPLHSVGFLRRNTRLVTGDADGWIVVWKLESKRPVAVWKAHDAAILGTGDWGHNRIVTHGRDNSFKVWKFGVTDESNLSTILPAESSTEHRPKPWLLHSLPVNTLNFCSFSMCYELPASESSRNPPLQDLRQVGHGQLNGSSDAILVAVPAPDDKKIDIHQLPSEKLVYRVPKLAIDTGMTMALKLLHHSSGHLFVIAGYEGGFTAVHLLDTSQIVSSTNPESAWTLYLSQPHSQPILSLDASPDGKMYYTSSADAVIAAHKIPEIDPHTIQGSSAAAIQSDLRKDSNTNNTSISPDAASARPFDQATEDHENDSSPIPVTFSKQTIAPSRISSSGLSSQIKFSKQSSPDPTPSNPPSGLSSQLAGVPRPFQPAVPKFSIPPVTTPIPAYKTKQTKHAGQQSLALRSDGRILATAGWDARIRIYSAKTLKEMAVLKWHKEGVYAVAFSHISDTPQNFKSTPKVLEGKKEGDSTKGEKKKKEMEKEKERVGDGREGDGAVMRANALRGGEVGGLSRLQQKREEEMQKKHWVAAGSKDGKVSLWEIY